MAEFIVCAHEDVRDSGTTGCCISCGQVVYFTQTCSAPLNDISPTLRTGHVPLDYSYNNFELEEGSQIRLITLLAAPYDEPLGCTMAHVSLDEDLIYDAVSYTWATEDGDMSKSSQLHCEGRVILITVNCEAALRAMRYSHEPRTVWIDSVCINQQNIRERNHQVSVMGRIYHKASTVQICINDPSIDYSACLDFLGGSLHWDNDTNMQTRELFKRKYFRRVWVIQEVFLARSLVLSVNRQSASLSGSHAWGRFKDHCKYSNITIPAILTTRTTPAASLEIQQGLRVTLQAEAMDARDQVYGIYSLLGEKWRHLIAVDYSMSLEQVFRNAVAMLIAEVKDLEILEFSKLVESSLDWRVASTFGLEQLRHFVNRRSHEHLGKNIWETCQMAQELELWYTRCSLGFESCNPDQDKWIQPPPFFRQALAFTLSKSQEFNEHVEVTSLQVTCNQTPQTFIPLPAVQCLPALRVRMQRLEVVRHCHPLIQSELSSVDYSARRHINRAHDIVHARSVGYKCSASSFETENSNHGVTEAHCMAGDSVCFVETVPGLMLLRQLNPTVWRIVGVCAFYEISSPYRPDPTVFELVWVY